MAIVYDEVGDSARRLLENIKHGKMRGILSVTVVYEYIIHWMRGRIPGLENQAEVLEYLNGYFKIMNLTIEDYVNAARIKVEGDRMLMNSGIDEPHNRRLSIVDSTVIAPALKRRSPIITGDNDLGYVAREMNIKVIW